MKPSEYDNNRPMDSDSIPVLYDQSRERQINNKKTYRNSGFSMFELVVTVAIMGILAAVVIPTYINSQAQAMSKTSRANMKIIRQAFINHFYQSVIDREPMEYPPEPGDNKMTTAWSTSNTLYNGRTVAELFSGAAFPYNPYGNPYLYELLPATPQEEKGFRITDPDMGHVTEFRP